MGGGGDTRPARRRRCVRRRDGLAQPRPLRRRLCGRAHRGIRALGCRKLNLVVWEGEDDAMAFWTGIGYYREKIVELAKELITQ
jgi:hypothetical protein